MGGRCWEFNMTSQNGNLFILLSQIIWGITSAIIKYVPKTLPSSLFIATRFSIASIVLFIIIILHKKYFNSLKKLSQKTVLQIIILGILGSGLADLLMVQAIRTIGVILAVMIARLEIPLGVIMAGIMLKEKITMRIIVATIVSFLGVIFVSYGDNISIFHNQVLYVGIGFALIAAFLWAFTGVFAKKILSSSISPIILAFGRLFAGGIFSLFLSLITLKSVISYYDGLTQMNWASLLFLAIFSSALPILFYYKGLEKIDAAKASILLSLSIIIALITGIFIGETLTIFQWAGIASILIGIYLVIAERPAIGVRKTFPIAPGE